MSGEQHGEGGIDTASVVLASRDVGDTERLRLLAWAAAPERLTYLAILDTFAEAQARYEVQLRPADVATSVAEADADVDNDSAVRYLDQLVAWGLLDRAWDSALVSSIEDYRRRRPVYRFAEMGERAYRAVRELLDAEPGEGRLQGFVLRSIAEDLGALHDAILADDGEAALVLLNRVDVVLRQLAERAAQFYVLVEAMAQEADVKVERFLELKDLLLTHLYGFLGELGRWSPVIAGHVRRIDALGADRLIDLVAEADHAVFVDLDARRKRWRSHWDGLVGWFAAAGTTRVVELDRRTTTAIRELTGLLRRLMEVRGRGASRATDMVELARWFWSLDEYPDAAPATNALFGATFTLGGARHFARTTDEMGDIAPSTAWADAPRVDVPLSLRSRGRMPSSGNSAAIPDDRLTKDELRRRRVAEMESETRAAVELSERGLGNRVLAEAEFQILMRLVDATLVEGVPVQGAVATAADREIVVRLSRSTGDTVVRVETGTLTVHGVDIEVAPR
ncbi:MAG: TIGR02677 family protein [Actinomycetia bacterium]|nr:TIGR02677 family protein [Actinomycetes bacterium]